MDYVAIAACEMWGHIGGAVGGNCANCDEELATRQNMLISQQICAKCGEGGFESDKICRQCGSPYRSTQSFLRRLMRFAGVVTLVLYLSTGTAWAWFGLSLSSLAVWWSTRWGRPYWVAIPLVILVPAPVFLVSAHTAETAYEMGFIRGVESAKRAISEGQSQRYAFFLRNENEMGDCCPNPHPSRADLAQRHQHAGFRAGAFSVLPPDAGKRQVAIERLENLGAKFYNSRGGRSIVLSGLGLNNESVELLQAMYKLECVVVDSNALSDDCVKYLQHINVRNLLIGDSAISPAGIRKIVRLRSEQTNGLERLWLKAGLIDAGLQRDARGGRYRVQLIPCRMMLSGLGMVNQVSPGSRRAFRNKQGHLLW